MNQGLAELGPPFVDERLNPPVYAVRAENSSSGVCLVLTAPSEAFPGLTVERRVSLLAGDVVRVDYRVINTTEQAQPGQLRLGTWSGQQGWLTIPGEDGVVREPLRGWGEYPQGETDMLANGASLAESWIALEDDGLCSGLLWHPGPKQDVRWGRIPYLTWNLGEIPPHSSVETPPIYLIGGTGDWRTVRGWWRRLIQPSGVYESEKPQQFRVLEVRCEPSPALINADHETIQLQLLSRRGKSLSGTLTLTDERFQADPAVFRFDTVDRDHPFTTPLRITAPGSPGAGFLQADVDTGPVTETRRVPLVRLGTPGTVRLTEAEDGVVVVDNGLFTLRVAPGFLGSLYALEREGANHLLSAYPEPRPFVWANPWYGGVHPFLEWMGNPRLTREAFTGGPVERVGERGIHWRGVQVRCAPQHKEIRWLRLELEYLTTPGSNLVALASRWTNVSSARMWPSGNPGIAAWAQVGGTREHSLVHWESYGEARQRRRSVFSAEGMSDKRVSVENAQTGDILTLVASNPRSFTYFEDFGEEGMHLMALTPLVFEPGETKETLSWLVLCRERDQLDAYGAALSQITRLP